jgi:predicted helicase
MLATLGEHFLEAEREQLEKFYQSVEQRVEKIDNAAGKQEVVVELYDKFFKNAFPKVAERLGIVYTPVEVVDFIIHSVEVALQQEFGSSVTDENVHILDPFIGTGTFMVRLLQSGLIQQADLQRKFTHELHANEITLLAYYIAAINIETTYHEVSRGAGYQPFEGMVLTDTFQMYDETQPDWVNTQMLPENHERVKKQKKQPIQVIIGNPPYSAGQTSVNDDNQNLEYPALDERIMKTYAAASSATLVRKLYDSYIRAIRWASDRIQENGVICFVTNGSFIDGNAMDGVRKCLTDEFTSIYCFNLRGNQRTSGETSRKEGGKIFGSGSRAAIAITLLIKNPARSTRGQLFYHDIGDYLSREEKFSIIKNFKSIDGMAWRQLMPNDKHDWINQRCEDFASFVSLGDKKNKTEKTFFEVYSLGIVTNRDSWAYNFAKQDLTDNMSRMIAFFNSQVAAYHAVPKNERPEVDKFIDFDATKISWTVNLKADVERNKKATLDATHFVKSMYRPFCKQWLYFDRQFVERSGQFPKIFPNPQVENLVICMSGIGAQKDFSTLIVDAIPEIGCIHNGQGFPLYSYEESTAAGLFDAPAQKYTRRDNLSDTMLKEYQKHYADSTITKADIFYYIYGILHAPSYKTKYAADLKKMLPRIPFAENFGLFSNAGKQLAHWHLNYETVTPYPLEEIAAPNADYRVQKMQYSKVGKVADKTTLIYNAHITLNGIPLETYEYIVNGKPALDWIIDRYQITVDKDSGIQNDPNQWSEDPRYILDLVKRIVTVSIESVKIINTLKEEF